ncbi:hypothetical protein Lgee_0581 [Legionella geestiana]|uniref:Uncharacterized protein n=1 Tax=Legionella geestiana TaxID=45065 RepID=A0A0W0U632_9GAMM|nr:hypothetical protein [Legionella geestiana]KTD03031.1 hypothetical protein Lgee_0581 [Legionella geestiana]QBS12313.1 hypothetical protein E4T54_05895 [Legionella geestiana]QDQ39974.1 hypothetical protein E3226_005965 [Legionella geestiana]STX52942.1 Uncharacterised protein [Legionella geestiana]
MRFIFALLMFFLPLQLLAADTMPKHCRPLKVAVEPFAPGSKTPALLFIRNHSSTDLWITHPVTNPGASAGFSSRLMPGQWSALALNKPKFAISCIESIPGHEQQVPCEGVIDACMMKKVTFPENLSGTFWAGEDMALGALIDYLGSRGIRLPADAR